MSDPAQNVADAQARYEAVTKAYVQRLHRYDEKPTDKRRAKLAQANRTVVAAYAALNTARSITALLDAGIVSTSQPDPVTVYPVTDQDMADNAGNPAVPLVEETSPGHFEDVPVDAAPAADSVLYGDGSYGPKTDWNDAWESRDKERGITSREYRADGTPTGRVYVDGKGITYDNELAAPATEPDDSTKAGLEAEYDALNANITTARDRGHIGRMRMLLQLRDRVEQKLASAHKAVDDHYAAKAEKDEDTTTPVVTLAPVNEDGRFVPIGTPVTDSADYDGPVGEYPFTVADGPAMYPRWDVTAPGGEKWRGMDVHTSTAVEPGSVLLFSNNGTDSRVVTDHGTFASLKRSLDSIRDSADKMAAARVGVKVGDLFTGDEPSVKLGNEATPTAEEQAVIDAGKKAQAKVDKEDTIWKPRSWKYREVFAKAGDVPSAEADHVTGTIADDVTVDPEHEAGVKDFAADTYRLPKDNTFTATFTMQEASPAFFQRIFPNARVVIGSDGKVEITANTVERAAQREAEKKPTTPEGRLLDEAAQVIGTDRNDQYGAAEDSFAVIAQFWNTWLTARWREIFDHNMDADEYTRVYVELSGADVANMLSLMKKARTAVGGYKRDNYLDDAGYVALAERCQERGQGL